MHHKSKIADSPNQYKPRFAHLRHKIGAFGEHSRTCAAILAKLHNLESNQNYALAEFFHTVSYETKLRNESPEKYNKLLEEKYNALVYAFDSVEQLKVFLYRTAKENYVVIMQIEGEANEVVQELTDGMDTLTNIVGEKTAFIFNGATFYNYQNIVPKEFREYYAKEKAVFYAYNKVSGDDVLVGTLPKDFVSYYTQPNYYDSPKHKTKIDGSKRGVSTLFGKILSTISILLVLLIIVLSVYAVMSPFVGFSLVDENPIVKGTRGVFLDWKNDLWHTKNCTMSVTHQSCYPTKPLYCDNGEIINRSDVCGCDTGLRPYQMDCIPIVNCTDGSLSPDCSPNKPYQCFNGTLIEKASLCGCPEDYAPQNDTCKEIERCAADGTIYGQCSRNQPLFCDNGALVERASACGCPDGLVIEQIGNTNGEKCVVSRVSASPSSSSPGSFANIYDAETKIHILINAQRAANGFSALNFDERLASIARKHSQDMAARGYFDHNSPEGTSFYDRYVQEGYNCAIGSGSIIYQGAENIFEESGYSLSSVPSTTVDGWMNSPGHRQNILTPYWQNEGIGVAQSSDGTVYITQDFC